jgi:hypothetical protein
MILIDGREDVFLGICAAAPVPWYMLASPTDYVHLIKGWLISTVCTTVWLLISALSTLWAAVTLKDRLELPLVWASLLIVPLCMFQAFYGLFRSENGSCFRRDGRFRLWMTLGLLPHFTLVVALLLSFVTSFVMLFSRLPRPAAATR